MIRSSNINKTVSSEEFLNGLQLGWVTIDARTKLEFENETIPGSINIDIEDKGYIQKLNILDKNIIYCIFDNSDTKSFILQKKMKDLGFLNVTVLSGGFLGWKIFQQFNLY